MILYRKKKVLILHLPVKKRDFRSDIRPKRTYKKCVLLSLYLASNSTETCTGYLPVGDFSSRCSCFECVYNETLTMFQRNSYHSVHSSHQALSITLNVHFLKLFSVNTEQIILSRAILLEQS